VPLQALDARLDGQFWLKLAAELRDLEDSHKLDLSDCYVGNQPIPPLAWLAEHGAMALHPALTHNEAIAQLTAGCEAQVTRCAAFRGARVNELIALVNKCPTQATAFNRLLGELTDYPTLSLLLADVTGQYLLPFPGTEPTVKHHSKKTAIHFQVIGHDIDVLCTPWGDDLIEIQKNIRGGASTIEGTLDVLHQLLDETSHIFGPNKPIPIGLPQGAMVHASAEPLFFARYEYNWDTRTVGFYWEPVSPTLNAYLQGLDLTQWVDRELAKTDRPLDVESQLARDLGL
jgi:hypothetical protein